MKRPVIDPAVLVILAGVCAALHVGKLPPALPVLRDALGVSLLQAGFLLSMVQLAGMSLGLAIGLAADSFGLLRSMLLGLGTLAVASVAGAWARDASDLLVLRALEGFGLLAQLGRIALAELVPARSFVAVPLAQRGAGRQRLVPGGQGQGLLAHAARPQALDQDARAVVGRGRLVGALDADAGGGNLLAHERLSQGAGYAAAAWQPAAGSLPAGMKDYQKNSCWRLSVKRWQLF